MSRRWTWGWWRPKPTPTEPAPVPDTPTAGSETDQYDSAVLKLVNDFRAQNGKPALTFDTNLDLAADRHSADMAVNDFFSHTGSGGTSVGSRVTAAGYNWSTVGENIAAGYSTPEAVVKAWINSEGHRKNMLGNFKEAGIGYDFLSPDTGDTNYTHYWTLNLGTELA